MNFAHIYDAAKESARAVDSSQRDTREDAVQDEICNFFCEINMLIQDVYICSYKALLKRVYYDSPEKYEAHHLLHIWIRTKEEAIHYVRQLFGKSTGKLDPIIKEVSEAAKYKSLGQLYSDYAENRGDGPPPGENLLGLLIKQLIGTKNTQLQNSILSVIIGYQLPKMEFVRHLENFFIIADDQCAMKHRQLSELMPQMADCLNQLASWLNVSDIKTLKQSSLYLAQWKGMVFQLYRLFEDEQISESTELKDFRQLIQIRQKDERFTKLFMRARVHTLIISFLKLSAKVKTEAAANVLKGNDRLGLHAVTFSRELLKVIEMSNKVLTVFCKDNLQSK